jgi:ribulose kinase
METPKLMWLKRHMPATWARAGLLLDLADFLTWRATGGATARSTLHGDLQVDYLAHERPGWQRDFFAAMGLGDLLEEGGSLPTRRVRWAPTSGRSAATRRRSWGSPRRAASASG